LRAVVHVALTARCEFYSRFVPRLKDAERANAERKKEGKPPRERRADADQEHGDHDADTKRPDSKRKSLAPLAHANVGFL
jgi:hypothetical protein